MIWRSYAGLLVGFVVFAVVLWLAHTVHEELGDPGFAQTVLIGVTGWAGGWLLGFVASPTTGGMGGGVGNFNNSTAAIAAFLGGFILAKMEPSLTPIFENGRLLNEPIYGVRVLIFIICFVVAAINMYVYREFNGRY